MQRTPVLLAQGTPYFWPWTSGLGDTAGVHAHATRPWFATCGVTDASVTGPPFPASDRSAEEALQYQHIEIGKGALMNEKLQQGDRFPSITLRLVGGDTIGIPDGITSRYLVLLFYRGHWCPYCQRQLAAFEARRPELEDLDAKIIAVSVDTEEQAKEVKAKGISFDIAYGATKEDAVAIGAWWEPQRSYIQPAEFMIGRGGVVLGSMYASGPVGRMGADEVIRAITNRERRRKEDENPAH